MIEWKELNEVSLEKIKQDSIQKPKINHILCKEIDASQNFEWVDFQRIIYYQQFTRTRGRLIDESYWTTEPENEEFLITKITDGEILANFTHYTEFSFPEKTPSDDEDQNPKYYRSVDEDRHLLDNNYTAVY